MRADSRQKLHRHKGFGDVVVCADIQTQYHVFSFGFGGQEKNGRVGNFPNLGGGGNAATAGAQLENVTVKDAVAQLVASIEKFYEE